MNCIELSWIKCWKTKDPFYKEEEEENFISISSTIYHWDFVELNFPGRCHSTRYANEIEYAYEAKYYTQ